MLKKANIFKFLALALCLAVIVGLLGVTACEGTAGKDGAAGAPGKSAYDIWLEQGNTGTEQDFLNSLKGDQGIRGDRGIEGEQGKDGKDGATWFTGAGCPDEIDVVPLTPNSKVGDLYLCTDCGAVWKKRSDSFWDEIANLKGPKGDKGDPGEAADDSFKLNVAAGQTADMPIDLPADTYVVEVALNMKLYSTSGKLLASVESSAANYSSAFVFSQEKTDKAANGTFIYYGLVIVKDSDNKITFAAESDFKLDDGTNAQQPKPTTIENAKVSITKWEQRTLKADGEPVEIIINGSNATADTAFKVPVDSSVGAGTYTLTIARVPLDTQDSTAVYDQTDTMSFATKLVDFMPSTTTKEWTITELQNQWLVFKSLIESSKRHIIAPATVTLTVKA